MGGGSGGSGSGGRSGSGGGSTNGDAGQPGEVVRAANTLAQKELDDWAVGGGRIKATGTVDVSKPVTITMSGRTYDHRSSLKDNGFKFNSGDKTWSKTVTGDKDRIFKELREVGRARRAERDMTAQLSN